MGFTRSYARGFQNKAIHKAAISDDEAVVVIVYEEGRLAFCRIREDKVWTQALDFSVFYRDIIYNRGHFFVVCFHGEVGVVRINKSNPYVASVIRMEYLTRVAPIPELPLVDCIRHRTYLVADPASGTIFTVKRIVRSYFDTETSSPHYIFTTLRFHVYEMGLEESTGEYKKNALEVESLGGGVMFLGLNSSMIVMASQFPDFKGNCIYDFLAFLQLNKVRKGCTDMGVFNMEDKTIYPLFPERAQPPFSPPTWITPTQ
ncbi:hypothetical protein MRB53_019000 [Persea americana]|uniref:Uncharacterized protein n=1 Tax=Persea americana TaxID=3435 RepID=A0ACC2MAC5_PERAE|nr:hypothetical protein MRB53_019000 [Persea americana]